MTGRHHTRVEAARAAPESRAHTPASEPGPGPLQRHALPNSLQEAEARYAAARDVWTAAMQKAASGRPADLAALAMAQEGYESALVELDRWRAGERVALEIHRPEERGLDAVIGQELAWRRLHEAEARKRPGFFGRLARRLSGRG